MKQILAHPFLLIVIMVQSCWAQTQKDMTIPLEDQGQVAIEGPHRFLEIAGLKGFHPTSLKTKAYVKTDLHKGDTGSISLWASPLEDLDQYRRPAEIDKDFCYFNFVTDKFPAREMEQHDFGFYWTNLYPPIVARFTREHIWNVLDRGNGPFAYGEGMRMRTGQWYNLVLTWDKPNKTIKIYANGIEIGHNYVADDFNEADPILYIGNTMMVIRDIHLTPNVLSGAEITENYENKRLASNDIADEDMRHENIPFYRPKVDIELDGDWKVAYSSSLTEKEDFEGWVPQTGDEYRDQFNVKITDEGLLFETPDKIARETRMNLWCPGVYEGDGIAVEYDFRLESDEGLALLMICANGMQRQDYMVDNELANSGSMREMLRKFRNYHWEYMRRVCLGRTDVEAQYVQKNPWGLMHTGCIDRLEKNKWYTLRFIKDRARLVGTIDGNTVFDVEDDPYNRKGPVLNFGRVILRQMFNTKMRYRNIKVYERKSSEVVYENE